MTPTSNYSNSPYRDEFAATNGQKHLGPSLPTLQTTILVFVRPRTIRASFLGSLSAAQFWGILLE